MRDGWGMMLVALLAAGPALAQDAVAGKETYLRYCATCHGTDGQGRGPTAAILTLQPTDLTLLRSGTGGEWPVARIVARIDGRDPMVAHGSPMPVWGEFFEGDYAAIKTPGGQPILTSQPIVDLLAYLETLQR
ncbi:MAG TPA: cytochrome c [Paracoccaceae bacterium]|nr:cytochrome c [Paracoccaceae bacterium]